jgi:hypothetical protein
MTRLDKDPERWKAFVELTSAGVSLNELRRTLGIDYRTVRRYKPDYRPFEVGGGGEASVIREVNRQLRELDRTGRAQKNRDAGFNLRGDVL